MLELPGFRTHEGGNKNMENILERWVHRNS